MSNIELGPSPPEEPCFDTVEILNQGTHPFIGDGRYYTLEIPDTVDVEAEQRLYEASGGRISIPRGDVLDHKTLDPATWFLRQGARFPTEE